MAKSLCRLLMKVKRALVAIFTVANMSLNAIGENKILAKISGFTVYQINIQHAVNMIGVAPIMQYTHMRNKNSNTQGSSPKVVKVIFHTTRNFSWEQREVPIRRGTKW